MADDQRPDPMQSFYLDQPPLPPRPATDPDDDEPLRPLPPIKIRRQGDGLWWGDGGTDFDCGGGE